MILGLPLFYCIGYLLSNRLVNLNDESGRMWGGGVMAYFNIGLLFQYLPEVAEENHEKS
jgi:hypothetical protein